MTSVTGRLSARARSAAAAANASMTPQRPLSAKKQTCGCGIPVSCPMVTWQEQKRGGSGGII
eukprot:1717390-Prymnesium_polylepis.1